MLKIRSIQDRARVLSCVWDFLAALENKTSVTKYTDKVAAAILDWQFYKIKRNHF